MFFFREMEYFDDEPIPELSQDERKLPLFERRRILGSLRERTIFVPQSQPVFYSNNNNQNLMNIPVLSQGSAVIPKKDRANFEKFCYIVKSCEENVCNHLSKVVNKNDQIIDEKFLFLDEIITRNNNAHKKLEKKLQNLYEKRKSK